MKRFLTVTMLLFYAIPALPDAAISAKASADIKVDLPSVDMVKLQSDLGKLTSSEQMKAITGINELEKRLNAQGMQLQSALNTIPLETIVHSIVVDNNLDYLVEAIKTGNIGLLGVYCTETHRCPELYPCCKLHKKSSASYQENKGYCTNNAQDIKAGCSKTLEEFTKLMRTAWNAISRNSISDLHVALQKAEERRRANIINIESTVEPGRALIHHAAAVANRPTIQYIIEQGGDKNLTLKNDWTPLMSAVQAGNVAGVHELIKEKAQLGIKSNGKTALDMAMAMPRTSTNKKITLLLRNAQ